VVKFCEIDELITDQGDIAIIIEEHPDTPGQFYITAYKQFNSNSPSKTDISYAYLSACDTSVTSTDFSYVTLLESADITVSSISQIHALHLPTTDSSTLSYTPSDITEPPSTQESTFVTRKYKPVARKIRPVIAELPDKFHIIHNIIGDPLEDMPTLSPNPPPFEPTGCYTTERRDIIDHVHPEGFLWPGERQLMHHFMCIQNMGFAWDDSERGRFHEDFFPLSSNTSLGYFATCQSHPASTTKYAKSLKQKLMQVSTNVRTCHIDRDGLQSLRKERSLLSPTDSVPVRTD
jgi:hypothetical protein